MLLRSMKITNDLNRSRSLQRRQLGVRLDLGMVLHLLGLTVVHCEQATVFPMLLFAHLLVESACHMNLRIFDTRINTVLAQVIK